MHASNAKAQIDAVITGRRTHKAFDGSALASAEIDELLQLASWAPNHRLTCPWRFTVLDQAAIAALGNWLLQQEDIIAQPDPEKGMRKITKLAKHYFPQLGAMIQVSCVRGPDPTREWEELAACSAAVQNILLGAEARGLASFWASSHALMHARTMQQLGADPEQEAFVASIWLGGRVESPERTPPLPLAAVCRRPTATELAP